MRTVGLAWILGLIFGCRTALEPRVEPPETDPRRAWGELLGVIVDEEGLVDYDALEAEREILDRYVAWIGKEQRASSRFNSRHAFWLNAYNALVMYAVLERGRPASVLDVDGWLPKSGSGFFFEQAFRVNGDYLSLWEIEHERVRELQMDYRDHAALNCASISCPPLRAELYGSALDKQLDDQMSRWVNDPIRGVRVVEGEAVFSPIYSWFGQDFSFWSGGKDLCTVTARFAAPALEKSLRELAAEGCPHRFSEYDWSLNVGD